MFVISYYHSRWSRVRTARPKVCPRCAPLKPKLILRPILHIKGFGGRQTWTDSDDWRKGGDLDENREIDIKLLNEISSIPFNFSFENALWVDFLLILPDPRPISYEFWMLCVNLWFQFDYYAIDWWIMWIDRSLYSFWLWFLLSRDLGIKDRHNLSELDFERVERLIFMQLV